MVSMIASVCSSLCAGFRYDGERYEGKRRKDVCVDAWVCLPFCVAFRYDGEWYEGKRHGQGKMVYVDATVYEGMWQNGMRCACVHVLTYGCYSV